MTEYLARLVRGESLSRDESDGLFTAIMAGGVAPELLGAILAAMAAKGESVDEIAGAAQAMRRTAVAIRAPAGAIDTCSTGGDGISTFNVSTAAAIIAAAAGAVVAKHGNTTSTRASGSADVMAALGVNIHAERATLERCLDRVRIAFLSARSLHPAMKHAAGARQALGIRTIFNLLGPLTNPAGVRRQIVGVPRRELMRTVADALVLLGAEHAWVVHGDGLCDLTTTGRSSVIEVRDGRTTAIELHPEDVGLPTTTLQSLLVDSPERSAACIREIANGVMSPMRHQAVLNAAGALIVAGVSADLTAGVSAASAAIDDGRAAHTLAALIEESNRA
jgi:anthranilate phosphoribosyltransferase